MNGDITGVQGVIHTWPCQGVVFSVNAGMGRRLTNQGTLERKEHTERHTEKILLDIKIFFLKQQE